MIKLLSLVLKNGFSGIILFAFFVVAISDCANGTPGILEGYAYPQPQPPFFDEEITPSPPIYIPPPQPPFQDEIPPTQVIPPTYLPPYPPLGTPPLNDDLPPPVDDTVVIPSLPPSNQYLPASSAGTSRQFNPLQVLNMSCLESRDINGFFRTSFRSLSYLSPNSLARQFPVMESSSPDCVITPLSTDVFRIDIEGQQRMIECGIRTCGSRMCLNLRMATVRGLRLADDPLVTLQCTPQQAVASHTKHLRFNAQSERGRSASGRNVVVATGGNQRRFDTEIAILRKSPGSDTFDQPLQQGSAVRLGDDLLLRCTVREGDGWRYSRMGAVLVRSTASQRSVTLVDEDGCRSPSMRTISPQQPQQIGPLTVQLPFRAFLFQGAAPADDLMVSVRTLACLRARDCYQTRPCEDGATGRRVTREAVDNFTSNNGDTDWESSEFQLRVLPREPVLSSTTPVSEEEFQQKRSQIFVPLILLLAISLVFLLCVSLVFIKTSENKRRFEI